MEKNPKDFYNFGFNVGKAAAQIILGEEMASPKKTQVAEVLNGMLTAFGGHFSLENLLFCISEEDQALLMLDVSIQAFQSAWEKKDIGDVIGGVIGLVGFVQQFKKGLPICEAIDTSKMDFARFISTADIAANPTKHFTKLEKDILIDGTSIMKDIWNGVGAWKHQDYEKFGLTMGNILALATKPTEVEEGWKGSFPNDNREMVAEVFQGFLEATEVGTFNFTNLLLCIYEADQAALALYEGVNLLEQAWTNKQWQDAVGGALFVFTAVQGFEQQALPVCEQIDQRNKDWTKFDAIAELTQDKQKTMKVIGENIVMNGVTITAEIIKAMEALEKGDYKTFGTQLGLTVMTATAHKEDLFLY